MWSVGDVVIRVTAATVNQASVTICRKTAASKSGGAGKETRATCMAKVDADCNGRVNTTDPACVALMKRTTTQAAAVPLAQQAAAQPGTQAAAAATVPAAAVPGAGRRLAADEAVAAEEGQLVAEQHGNAQPAESNLPPEQPHKGALGGA